MRRAVGRRPHGVAVGLGSECDGKLIIDRLDPAELLGALIARVIELELNRGIENALSATLQATLASVESDRPATIQQLEAFVNQVEPMRGQRLTEAEADELIADASNIIAAIQAL